MMTSRKYDDYKIDCEAAKSKWWLDLDAKARQMASDELTLEEFARHLYDNVKWVQYHNVLLCLFLHYREKMQAMHNLSGHL